MSLPPYKTNSNLRNVRIWDGHIPEYWLIDNIFCIAQLEATPEGFDAFKREQAEPGKNRHGW